jgi:hypothetical protein
MNSTNRSGMPAATGRTAITPDQAWKLAAALDDLGTCLWEIFHDDFIRRCHPETGMPIREKCAALHAPDEELPF